MKQKTKDLEGLLESRGGIQLDIGAGRAKQPDWIGMDIQDLEGVDIVHDWNDIPWPLPDESCVRAMASHVIEHVPPHNNGFLKFMDEVWRVLIPDGQFAIAMPYATSPGMYQDPTHCNFCNEKTWLYFDPLDPVESGLYQFYKPKPWKIATWPVFANPNGNMEVLLIKRRMDVSYE